MEISCNGCSTSEEVKTKQISLSLSFSIFLGERSKTSFSCECLPAKASTKGIVISLYTLNEISYIKHVIIL
jgi:hypothetical protein